MSNYIYSNVTFEIMNYHCFLGVQFIEEKPTIQMEIHHSLQQKHILDSPPVSPVSTSPYIPISECITGKSPILLNDNVSYKYTFLHIY